ncbi:HAMP domain-containing sensor histidine kinase [Paenibacillus sp. MMS20-IR301]|uniref:sensor histidine kinase n=1 Tax=Paenibacillus sp. MMS20-IR301 TaxID=2895946 RepID=UPI0028E81FBE|nr:HAMP domain-containing sensor histidine kinase [Paenibacillus sp. MMS20-IR301]WNS42532.1 HAMP domain-containing sensor histidine kinase [Paenibacillus sp. MMS20-IR301]
MKTNLRLSLRLIIYLIIILLLLALVISGVLALVTEVILPREGNEQDLGVLISVPAIFLGFMIFAGWSLGRPLYYIIRRIDLLAGGVYADPAGDRKIYSGKAARLKRPYRLFKELIIQLQALSDVLENSSQERRRLDAMRMDWVAGISHDLKTPLTYIKGYSSMMLSPQYEWTKEETTLFLTEIERKADHMQELIGDLNLSFRLDEQQAPIQLERTDLVEFVRRIVADISNDPRAGRYSLIFGAAKPHMETVLDRRLLGRALHNLILNAVLHNPPGTRVKVHIRQTARLEIDIADDGAGMSEESVERLFDKYYRGTSTDILSEGTGLGMAIARQLVLAHEGDISVASRLNEGTVITVALPLYN